MATYAELDASGVWQNTISWDGVSAYTPPSGWTTRLVSTLPPGGAQGWTLNGKSYDDPITEWEFVKRMSQSTLKPSTDNPTPSGYLLIEDPRWIEFRDARQALRLAGLDADEATCARYTDALRPVVELFAEHATLAPRLAQHTLASLVRAEIPSEIVFEVFHDAALI
jgi:hypothetical protein